MDIVEERDDYSRWHVDTECSLQRNGCSSKLRIYLPDIYLNHYTSSTGWDDCDHVEESYWYICPVCGHLNTIDKKKLPALYRADKLQDYSKEEWKEAERISRTTMKETSHKRLVKIKGGKV